MRFAGVSLKGYTPSVGVADDKLFEGTLKIDPSAPGDSPSERPHEGEGQGRAGGVRGAVHREYNSFPRRQKTMVASLLGLLKKILGHRLLS
ncbi:Hypothetical protein BN69_1727 [Methylocystis sp. SC2]|nr:Hypothetical protein BN69_1727 [Methylocystis sp. SC2]